MEASILEMGRVHLARDGAAALSLRAVARDLGVASSAVYRYVDSRDELLTRLIIDAFTALGDAVDAALAESHDPMERFTVIAVTVRGWALAHPHLYALIYGSPVPGYKAPGERTIEPGTRVVMRLLEDLADLAARPDGPEFPASEHTAAGRALETLLADPAVAAYDIPPALLSRGLAAWNLVLGAITAEIFGQYGPGFVSDPEAHFAAIVRLADGLIPPAGRI
jgi:AcrR family transcriptional regulator